MTLFDACPEDACPAYLNLRNGTNRHCLAGRHHCEDLWRDFEPFADTNFLKEFPIHPHERWFEMYLTVALKRAGLDVQCPKPGPDVLVTIGGHRVWIEATCASAGEAGRPDSVPERHISKPGEPVVVIDRPTNEMTLRIRTRLEDKQKKFQNWISDGTVAPADVTVVAINVNRVPYAWPDVDELMPRALYGLGDTQLNLDRDTGAIVDQGHEHKPAVEKKHTGKLVCLQPFIDGSMPHISAVFGSWEESINLPRRLGDGLTLFPNLTAATPWPNGSIPLGGEWTSSEDASGDWKLTKVSYIP